MIPPHFRHVWLKNIYLQRLELMVFFPNEATFMGGGEVQPLVFIMQASLSSSVYLHFLLILLATI